jgi:acyl carrier protein
MTAPFIAPRNETEARLAALWAEFLGRDQVGIIDNIFDLGSDSVQMTKLITRISEAFDVELTIRNFFDAPTVQALADHILSRRQALQAAV